MKIKKKNIYYGAALSQIADNSTFTSINKFTEKDGLYRINDYITILIKYSDPESAYSGRFRPGFRFDCDRDSEMIATGIPTLFRPRFRSNPTGY